MRIDAHVHYMPPSLAKNLTEFAAREPYWGLLTRPPSIQGFASAERMIDDMDQAGLHKVILVGEYFQQPAACVTRNNQALEIMRRWPNRVMALATLQPKAGPAAVAELKRCVEAGMVGVGELNPYAQGFALTDPDFLAIVEACLEYDVPLNLHVSEEIGPYYVGKSTTPVRHYYQLARRYPALKLILAHWGGGLFFYEMMPRVQSELKNVWYDTAATPLLYTVDKIFRVAMDAVDHRKILYGSDYPLRIYPRTQRQPDFRPFMADINRLELPTTIYDDIMGHNAARLFGLIDCPPDPFPQQEAELGQPAFEADPIKANLSVSLVAEIWPETRPVFEKFGILWQDSAVPMWEPIFQAAAARGHNPEKQQRLMAELNEAIDRSNNVS